MNDETLETNEKISTQEAYLQAVKARADAEMAMVHQKVLEAEFAVKKADDNAIRMAQRVEHIVRTCYMLVTRMLSAAGIVVDAVFSAFLQLIFSIISVVLKAALAKSMTYDFVGSALAVTAAGMMFEQAVQTEREKQANQAEIEQMKRIKDNGVLGL